MAVLVPLFTTLCIVVDWSVMPEFKVSEIYCYVYVCTLVHLHIALWFTMCCSVATTTHHLMNMLRKVKMLLFLKFIYCSISSNKFWEYFIVCAFLHILGAYLDDSMHCVYT
jgi:hypothetical protein